MALGFGRFIFEGVAVIPLCRTSGSQWFPLRVSQYPRFWGFHSMKVALDFGILWDFHMNESRKMKGYISISCLNSFKEEVETQEADGFM